MFNLCTPHDQLQNAIFAVKDVSINKLTMHDFQIYKTYSIKSRLCDELQALNFV